MKLKDMHDSLDRELTDPEYAAIYLDDALNQGSQEEFLLALRNVIRANQGMTKIATEASLGRESLYKSLSETGNPQFTTVIKILSVLGLKIAIEPLSDDSLCVDA
jgi:probable addiction module antidote protein